METTKSGLIQQRLLTLLMIATLFSFGAFATFADEPNVPVATPPAVQELVGSGTSYDPYLISTCEDLQKVNDHLDSSFMLTTRIDCANLNAEEYPNGFQPLGIFTGAYFDGRNNEIVNLNINASSNAIGLFQSVSQDSTVRNVSISDMQVINTSTENPEQITTGGVAGINEGTVENINMNRVTINSQGIMGSIVGYNSGTLHHVSSNGLEIFATTSIQHLVGGVAGYNTGDISEAAAQGNISTPDLTTSVCGGIVGVSTGGVISQTYSGGLIECLGNEAVIGGIAGQLTDDAGLNESVSVAYYNYSPNNFDGGIVGSNLANADLSTNAFDQYNAGTYYCDDLGNANCLIENMDNSDPNHFVGTSNISPINVWNMSTWNISEGNYPWMTTANLVPTAPKNLAADQSIDNDIHLKWIVPDYINDLMYYEVFYSTDGGASWTYAKQETQLSTWVEDTDMNLVYTFRIRAVTQGGIGYYSNETMVGQKPSVPTNVSVNNVQTRSFTVSWDDPGVDPSKANNFYVNYRKYGSNDWLVAQYLRFPEKNVGVSRLDDSTEYEVRVQATNGRGTSDWTEPVRVTTGAFNTYDIATCEQLQNVQNDLYGNYRITGDIDCSATVNWDNGKGFNPIGDFDRPFSGTIDGQNHSIFNLNVVRDDKPGGLISFADDATIKNLKLNGGLIDHSRTSGELNSIFGSENNLNELPVAGGLIGIGDLLTIDNVESNLPVYTSRIMGISGGLIGGVTSNYFFGDTPTGETKITNSKSTGNVEGYIAGGVMGLDFPVYMVANHASQENVDNAKVTLENIQRSGSVKCTQVCGGILSASTLNTTMNNVTNTGDVTSNLTDFDNEGIANELPWNCSFQSTGGLVGAQVMFPLSILDSFNSGKISSIRPDTASVCMSLEGSAFGIGGIIGSFISPADGVFDLIVPGYVGNSMGEKKLTIHDTTTSGEVYSNVPYYTGGLAGFLFGDVMLDGVSSSGKVTNTSAFDPMFAPNFSTYATGGLVGKMLGGAEVRFNGEVPNIEMKNAQIKNSHSSSLVYSNNVSGGFIGSLSGMTEITKSYATGNVTGGVAGGFIGGNFTSVLDAISALGGATVTDTYSSGNVYVRDKSDQLTVGGGYIGLSLFVGDFKVSNSYSSGAVRVENNATTNRSVFGGFAGGVGDANAAFAILPADIQAILGQVGLSLHNDFEIQNVFTASSVPNSTDLSGVLPYFASKDDVSPGIMSGSMFGASLSISQNNFVVVNPKNYTENVYYDSSNATNNMKCGYTLSNFIDTENGPSIPSFIPFGNDVCSSVTSSNVWKNSTTQAPLNAWNFSGGQVWHKHANGFPTFDADVVNVPDPVDNPDLGAPSNEPPKVASPPVKVQPEKLVRNLIKYVNTGSNTSSKEAIGSALGEVAKVLDTPTISKALEKEPTTKAAKDAQRAQGWLAGFVNLLLKYLKYIIAAIIGGALATYLARKDKTPKAPKSDGEADSDEDDDQGHEFSYASQGYLDHLRGNSGQSPGQGSVRHWDSPPPGFEDDI